MFNLLIILAVLTFFFAFAVAVIALIRWLYPPFNQWIPEGWHTAFSFRFVGYYMLAGAIMLLIGKQG